MPRYIDSGSRDASQALASWLIDTLSKDVAELRIQTGFFSFEATGVLMPVLQAAVRQDSPTAILIGSNDATTLRDDVAALVRLMGIPRKNARLGIVSFSGAYFHPKTFHIRRKDGSEVAYVGSANLTPNGLAVHVEAGVTLDTHQGDPKPELSRIAAAIDYWFKAKPNGFTLVDSPEIVSRLADEGVLAIAPKPRQRPSADAQEGASKSARPRLSPLVKLPRVESPAGPAADEGDVAAPSAATPRARQEAAVYAARLTSAPKEGFPPYLLFAPGADRPTSDAEALSGAALPGGAIGLIVQLNKDSARHFMGGSGTANISIPVATLSTLRFGVFGKHSRPRAEYGLDLRYVMDEGVVAILSAATNVMGYGFTEEETGHGDVRMLVPRETYELGEITKSGGLPTPKPGDLALLEWPTSENSRFRLSFIPQNSRIGNEARAIYSSAARSGQLVGNGACWLLPGLSPSWE